MLYQLRIVAVSLILVLSVSCGADTKPGTGPDVGMEAPNITGTLPDGSEFNLTDLRGKMVVIDFWGTWCGPCIREAPNLIALQNNYKHVLDVVSVALEKKNDGRSEKVASRLGFNWPYRLNEEITFLLLSETAGNYDVRDIPSSFLLDENGVILLARTSAKEIQAYLSDRELVDAH